MTKSKTLNLAILFLISFMIFSCENNNTIKLKELELKQKELELKEREIKLNEVKFKENRDSNFEAKQTQKVAKPINKKELRYLYHANGGMLLYFNDGTIVGCPRCDFIKSNIVASFSAEPDGTYTVEEDGSLLINNNDKEFPNYNEDNGWALIDYKWNKKVPQY